MTTRLHRWDCGHCRTPNAPQFAFCRECGTSAAWGSPVPFQPLTPPPAPAPARIAPQPVQDIPAPPRWALWLTDLVHTLLVVSVLLRRR